MNRPLHLSNNLLEITDSSENSRDAAAQDDGGILWYHRAPPTPYWATLPRRSLESVLRERWRRFVPVLRKHCPRIGMLTSGVRGLVRETGAFGAAGRRRHAVPIFGRLRPAANQGELSIDESRPLVGGTASRVTRTRPPTRSFGKSWPACGGLKMKPQTGKRPLLTQELREILERPLRRE